MKKVLIIGATSHISHMICRLWAREGASFYLVGRNEQNLKDIAVDLKVRGGKDIFTKILDLSDIGCHQKLIEDAYETLEFIDVILVAYGSLSNQLECQTSVDLTLSEINNNGLSLVALLTEIAKKLEIKNRGTLAVISSVAGDRGRKSNYVYGSSKALLTVFLQGLQHRFSRSSVKVVIIKPGPTDTPMTKHLKGQVHLASTELVSRVIFEGINKGSCVVYAPPIWRLIMFILRMVPSRIFNKLDI